MARTAVLRPLALVLALCCASAAQATVTVEGSADSLSVAATDVDRAEVVAAIMARLGIKTEGSKVEPGVITGTFKGSLSDVLRSILSANGFAIAYQAGRPIRVSFPYHGVASAALDPEAMAAPPGTPEISAASPDLTKGFGNASNAAPSTEDMLAQQLLQQMPEALPAPTPSSSNGEPPSAKELAEMTKRAVEELRQMEKMTNSAKPTP